VQGSQSCGDSCGHDEEPDAELIRRHELGEPVLWCVLLVRLQQGSRRGRVE
jgi:hypothetical protein